MGPGIGVGPLAPNRQAPAMPQAPVGPDINEPLDVHGDFGPKGTFYLEVPFDLPTQEIDLLVVQILSPAIRIHATTCQKLLSSSAPDPVDIGQGHLDAFPSG